MAWLRVLLTDFARAFYAPRALYRDIAEGRKSPSWAFVLVPVGTTIAVKVEEKVHLVLAEVIALVGIGATGIVTYTYIR